MKCKVRFIRGRRPYALVPMVLAVLFSATSSAQLTQEEQDKTAILSLMDKINLAWQSEKPSILCQEILSDKGFVVAMPKPDNPSEAAIINKQRFCEFLDNMMQSQQRPKKHEHKVESITVIGPLAYEIGTSLHIAADGAQRHDKVMNIFAKDETGWKLIYSTPADNIKKAFASGPNDIPKTQNLSAEQTKNLEEYIRGSFSGIGVGIDTHPNGIYIKNVIPGGPADSAGLKDGEVITTINGESTVGISLERAVSLIKGPEGTSVNLKVLLSNGTNRDVSVVRRTVIASGVDSRVLEPNIGLLAISGFNKETSAKVRDALMYFQQQKIKGIVLDLRDNKGGLLPAVKEITGMFTGPNQIMWYVQYTGQANRVAEKSTVQKMAQWPVVVLINPKTRCGGELLASAIRSGAGSELLGQKTFGEGSIYKLEKQADGTSQKIPTGYFFTADGQVIDGQGIKPDRELDPKLSSEEVLKQAVYELTRKIENRK